MLKINLTIKNGYYLSIIIIRTKSTRGCRGQGCCHTQTELYRRNTVMYARMFAFCSKCVVLRLHACIYRA
jgi:hypothetical protein